MYGSVVALNPARVIVKLGADHAAGANHGTSGASELDREREQHLDRRPDGNDVARADQDARPTDVFGAAVEPGTSAGRSIANRNADRMALGSWSHLSYQDVCRRTV